MTTTTTVTPEIAAFAAGVRAALADLPAEERDELTEGLELDLAEAYAEDLARELPDPVAYAEELRTAAGLPRRIVERRGIRGATSGLVADLRVTAADAGRRLRGNPAAAATLDFLGSLRPAWWLARGFAAAFVVNSAFLGDGVLPSSFLGLVVLVGCVVGSVAVARRTWPVWVRAGIVVGNAVAVVALVVALDQASTDASYVDDTGGYAAQGLVMNGSAVRNVFAYDAEGEPLEGVQLFDQDGRPLEVLLDPQVDEFHDGEGRSGLRMTEDGTYEQVVPAVLANGRSLFNVFPLSLVPVVHDEMGNAVPSDEPATAPPAPFATAPEVVKPPKVAQSNE